MSVALDLTYTKNNIEPKKNKTKKNNLPTNLLKMQKNEVPSLEISSIKTGFKRLSEEREVNKFARAYDMWMYGLSEKECLGLVNYTRDGYENVNAVLRGIENKFEGDNEQHCKYLSQALDKAKIHENVTVYRGVGKTALGSHANLKPEQLVGKVIRDKGFMSTTLLPDGIPEDDIALIIKVPKGTSGAYVGGLSVHENESEVLLNAGQQMIITNVYNDGKTIVCEVI